MAMFGRRLTTDFTIEIYDFTISPFPYVKCNFTFPLSPLLVLRRSFSEGVGGRTVAQRRCGPVYGLSLFRCALQAES
jgi:hypothetical protein